MLFTNQKESHNNNEITNHQQAINKQINIQITTT